VVIKLDGKKKLSKERRSREGRDGAERKKKWGNPYNVETF
jgi:hypothetical protein